MHYYYRPEGSDTTQTIYYWPYKQKPNGLSPTPDENNKEPAQQLTKVVGTATWQVNVGQTGIAEIPVIGPGDSQLQISNFISK